MAKGAPAPTELPIKQGVEPSVEGGEAGDAPAGASAPTQEQEHELARKLHEKGFAQNDHARNAITARRAEVAEAERVAQAAEDPVQYEVASRLAGAAAPGEGSEPAAPTADAPGGEDADAGSEEEASGAPAPAAALATGTGKVKIIVDGVEQEVASDLVLQAGVAALQKTATGDARLREATTYEARLRDWSTSESARLQRIAENLARGLDASGQPIARTASPPPPSGAEAPADVEAAVSEALKLLVEDNQAGAAKALAKVLVRPTSAAPAPQPAGPAPGPGGAESRIAVNPPPVRRGPGDVQAANQVFNDEYGDLDDTAFNYSQQLAIAKLKDPENATRDVRDIVREAGNAARKVFRQAAAPATAPAGAPAPAPSPGQVADEGRRTLKARLPLSPVGATGRAPGPAPAPQFPSNSQYVQQLQRGNRSNSSPR